MNYLLTALMSKMTGSTLSTAVGGRIYLDAAPELTPFPYIVFFIVSAILDRTFTEVYTDALVQFSIFSSSSGAAEITTLYNDLHTLLDEHSLTITSNTLVWMREANLTTMFEDLTTPSGTVGVRHWAVDYEIKTSLQ